MKRQATQLFEKSLALSRSQGLRQSLFFILGNMFAQVFSAVSLIIITRVLGPTKFGEFSIGFALLLILTRLNDLGTTFVVQKFGSSVQDKTDKNKIFSFAWRVKLMGAFSIACIGVPLGAPLAELLHFSQPLILQLAFVLSAATVCYELLQAILQSLQRFTQAVVLNTSQAILKLAAALSLLVSSGIGSIGIFVMYMLAPGVPVLFGRFFVPQWYKINLFQDLSAERSKSASLARHAALSFVMAGVIENIDILFVQNYLTTYDAGLLSGVSRIALLFNLAAYSLANVLNPRVARYKSYADLRTYSKKAWLLAGVCVIGFLAFVPLAGLVISYSIGAAYLPATTELIVLMAAALLSIAAMPFIALFFSIDAPWYFSVAGVLQLATIILGNMLFVPQFGLEAAAWTRLVSRVVLFIFTILVAQLLIQQKKAWR